MRSIAPLVIAVLLSPLAAHAESQNCEIALAAGETVRHDWPGYHGFLKIHQPASPPGPHGYPVILWYHGYSDTLEPNVRIPKAITGGDVFLLVGMDYGSERFYEDLERIRLDDETQRVRQVLALLSDCVSIDRRAVILGGYSQGGYATTLIGERLLGDIAGMIVLGAGRSLGKRQLPPDNALNEFPVFVGAGEDDREHGDNAQASATLYALLGASVSIERWPETDHAEGWAWYQQDATRSDGVRGWLNDVLDRADATRARHEN